MRHLFHKPSPAMVVACLALFVGTTGVSYAAATIGSAQIKKNAVKNRHINTGAVQSKQILDGQVKTEDLADNAVIGKKVADASLTGADLAKNSVSGERIADGTIGGADVTDGAIDTADLADNAVTGAKVKDNSLTGDDVDESTLGQVPSAAKLAGRPSSDYLTRSIYKTESAVVAGTAKGDGTFVIAQGCNAGDVLLSGGPANVNATSTLVESFPAPGTTNAWQARINTNGAADNFSVVVLCVDL